MPSLSPRRRIATALWHEPTDSAIRIRHEVDATAALAYLAEVRARTGVAVTMVHLVGRAIGRCLAKVPQINGRIVWGRWLPHQTADVCFLAAVEGGVGQIKVERIDERPLVEIAEAVRGGATRLRDGKDESYRGGQRLAGVLPVWLLRPLLWLGGWLTSALGVQLRAFGLERFPFGGAIVSTMGEVGPAEVYLPATPIARVGLSVFVCPPKERPVAVDGQVVVRPMLDLCFTVDHRYADGTDWARLRDIIDDALSGPGLRQPDEPARERA